MMHILLFLSFLLLLLAVSKLLGSIFIRKLMVDPPVSIQLFIGIVVTTSIAAVFITAGKTILLPIFIIFLFQLYSGRNDLRSTLNFAFFKELKSVLIAALVCSAVVIPLLIIPLEGRLMLTGDYLFYGKLGSYILETGYETKNLNYFLQSENYTEIYHYLDIWLYGIVQKLTGLNSNQSVIASIFVIILPLVYQSMLDLFNALSINKFNWMIAFIAVIVMVQLSGSTFLFNLVFKENEFSDQSGIALPKLIILYAFFILFMRVLISGEMKMLFLLAGVFSLTFTTTLPIYVGLSGILYLKKVKWAVFRIENLRMIFPLIFMLLYLSLFYFLFSSNSELNVIHQSSFPLDVASFKTRMNICGKTTIYMFLGMLPIIAAAVLFRKNDAFRKYKAILGWSVLGSVIGVGVWSLVFHKVDSVQLWSNFYYPTVGVLSVVCLYYLLMERKWIHVVFLLLFVCADLFMFTPDISLIRKPQKPSEKYAFLDGKRVALFNYYDPKMNVYSRNEAVSFGSFSELMSFTNAKLISFSTVEIHSQDAVFEQIVRQSHLYQLKPFPLDKSEEEYVVYQDTMLSKLKIDYIVVNKKRTNPLVMKKLKLELIPLEDVNYRIYKIIH